MEVIKRFGVSIEENLLLKFDEFIRNKNYKNRSEAIRDLIREKFVSDEWEESDKNAAGAVIMVYDHHTRELMDKIINIQHDYENIIISSQHIHMDHHNCMEIIILKGRIKIMFELQAKLKAIKGVKHSILAKSTLAENM